MNHGLYTFIWAHSREIVYVREWFIFFGIFLKVYEFLLQFFGFGYLFKTCAVYNKH